MSFQTKHDWQIYNLFLTPVPPYTYHGLTSDIFCWKEFKQWDHFTIPSTFFFQFTVFRHLFRFWDKFCTFRGNHAEEKILPTIERIRKHERAKQRAEQQRLDELALKVILHCIVYDLQSDFLFGNASCILGIE